MSKHLATISPDKGAAELIDIHCARERRRLEAKFEAQEPANRQAYWDSCRAKIEEALSGAATRALQDYRSVLETSFQKQGTKALLNGIKQYDDLREARRAAFRQLLDNRLAEVRAEGIRECELRQSQGQEQIKAVLSIVEGKLREIVAPRTDIPIRVEVTKLPRRKTTTTVTRGGDGAITGSEQIEQDS